MEIVQKLIDYHMLSGIDLKEYAEIGTLILTPREKTTLEEYEDFVRRYCTKNIRVLHRRNLTLDSPGVFASLRESITVPYDIRHSSEDALTEIELDDTSVFCPFSNRSQNLALILHEIGHIEHNHYNQRVNLLIIHYVLCLIGLVYEYFIGDYVMNTIVVLYFFFYRYYFIQQEYEADEFVAHMGYGEYLIQHLKMLAKRNSIYGDMFCTSSGENLRDLTHPLICDRIKNIQKVLDSRILSH